MGGNLDHPLVPRPGLSGKKAIIQNLQIHRTTHEADRRQREAQHYRACTPEPLAVVGLASVHA